MTRAHASVASLIEDEHLPPSYAGQIERWWRPLAELIAGWHKQASRPIIVGINGAQGSGKSTLSRFLAENLLPHLGLSATILALDDFYLTRAERLAMADTVHPLFRTRGVPGTHDVALGKSVLSALCTGHEVRLPRFSKALDDRLPVLDWTLATSAPDIILFEGWCVGARPQSDQDLTTPVNALEAEDDPKGIWRKHVNTALSGEYAQWFSAIDHLVMLKPTSFEDVVRNRLLQEKKLRMAMAGDTGTRGTGVMDDDAVVRFISHYERLTRHMFRTLPGQADKVYALDEQQNVISAG